MCLRCYQLETEIAELKQNQKSFNPYNIVSEQIRLSRVPRIDWRLILGETLTKVVASYYARGLSAEGTYQAIETKLFNMAIENPEVLRKLKIGVAARFGEITSESKRINEVRAR